MKKLIRTFTGRMILAELVIHATLASLAFIIIVTFVEQNYKSQFIQHIYSNTDHLVDLLTLDGKSPAGVVSTMVKGEVVHAQLLPEGQRPNPPKQDQAFGEGDDDVFYISIPLALGGASYVLHVGYDEKPTAQLIAKTHKGGLYTLAAYIVASLLLTALLGPKLTRPLVALRDAARRIGQGDTREHLQGHSNMLEVQHLANDLELMRTALIDQQEALLIREARITNIMDNVIDALITINEHGEIQSFNLSAERIFGYDAHETIGTHIDDLFVAPLFNDNPEIEAQLLEDTAHREPVETLARRKDGSAFHMEVAISEICQMEGCLFIVVCRDISERKQAEMEIKSLQEDLEQRVIKRTRELADVNKELERQALHDALTELPNRILLQDRLQQATRAAKREHHALALMIMDLDRFKEINDTLGHHYGDLLLQQVAVRMRSALRDSDTIARLGGDEFSVLLPVIKNEEQAVAAAIKIIEAMEPPFTLEGQQFHVGISIGITLFPKDGDNHANLMRRADVAMYAAKRSQCGYALYNPSQDIHSVGRLAMVGDLRKALESRELTLNYQPTTDLKTHQIIGVEALLRWEHPQKGAVLPEDFISLAEHTGLIKQLTLYVLDEALKQLHLWYKKGINIRMAVNLSARNLHDPELINYVTQTLERWKVSPHALQMEITESAIMEDPIRAMTTLSHLHDMGVKLSIDDFGTGYSSLMYLKQLPVDEIKIDKSFVRDMCNNVEDKVIVRSTIDLAHNMGHQVIAEGVDNATTLELLREMGCDLAQGYHISSPINADAFEEWFEKASWKSSAGTRHKSSGAEVAMI